MTYRNIYSSITLRSGITVMHLAIPGHQDWKTMPFVDMMATAEELPSSFRDEDVKLWSVPTSELDISLSHDQIAPIVKLTRAANEYRRAAHQAGVNWDSENIGYGSRPYVMADLTLYDTDVAVIYLRDDLEGIAGHDRTIFVLALCADDGIYQLLEEALVLDVSRTFRTYGNFDDYDFVAYFALRLYMKRFLEYEQRMDTEAE